MAKNFLSVATIIPDTSNKLFQLAVELVNQSSRNIFLTGKAGTGKTTFLKYIRENCLKQMAVVAPTGVAAINAGGVTIHSFFQLPLSPFVPNANDFSGRNEEVINSHSLIKRLRINTEKRNMLRQLELLVIDEVSMVRCDIMDAIDTVLRYVRHRPYEKFGGVQVLFIGDMFQLPPVIKEKEWNLLSEFYSSPYFFDSIAMKEDPPLYLEFDKIYRQSEERFIRLLNQVRNNELDEEGIKMLQSRYQPSFRHSKEDGYIVLATHNEMARNINARELSQINSEPGTYNAEIKGEFPDTAYPADEQLQLKAGAQVMFIKNDSDKSKRYFNGKIGIITLLEKEKILVCCKDESTGIEVKKETWENIRYTFNKTSRQMEEEMLGSFTQYPLRLAWAITIHKSQGLTFEKAIIDAGQAFAPGQVYVALSRCTNLEGMVLKSEIKPKSLFIDQRIVQFSYNNALSTQLQQEFVVAKRDYQQKILLSIFDFSATIVGGKEWQEYLSEHKTSFNDETFSWTKELLEKINALQQTAAKFQGWLEAQFQQSTHAGENALLVEKTMKAAEYFIRELDPVIAFLQQSPVVTDSKLHAKEVNESVRDIFAQLSLKKFLLQGFDGKIDMESWQRRKRKFVLPPFSVNAYAGASKQKTESPHPVLHQQLRKLRDEICSKKDIPIYIIAGSKTIDEMAAFLPQTPGELEQVSGFGKAKIEKYGQQFLEIIIQYCKEHNLISRISEKPPKRKRKETQEAKTDTKAESFRLYNEGLSVADIAKARNLTIQTIEGHLAYYVQKGEIDIEELVSPEKIVLIEPAIRDFDSGSIIPIKEELGNDIGFGEIRLVIAWALFKKGHKPGR